jgi:PPOX class probable F420-dependent enzyme
VNSPKEESGQQPSDALGALNALHDAKYLSLESYRQSGAAVRTPVWFVAGPGDSRNSDIRRLYVYTTADSGKARRIRRCGSVRIAACNVRGKVTASWSDALAEVVTGQKFELGMRLLTRKYFPWKQLLNLSAMFVRRQKHIVLAISPVPAAGSPGDGP